MRSRDTSDRAATVLAEANGTLGPEERFVQAMELSDLLRAMAKARIRSWHPEYGEDEITRALTHELHREVAHRQ